MKTQHCGLVVWRDLTWVWKANWEILTDYNKCLLQKWYKKSILTNVYNKNGTKKYFQRHFNQHKANYLRQSWFNPHSIYQCYDTFTKEKKKRKSNLSHYTLSTFLLQYNFYHNFVLIIHYSELFYSNSWDVVGLPRKARVTTESDVRLHFASAGLHECCVCRQLWEK